MKIEEFERTVGGYRTFYRVAGEGRPLVLIHGVGGSSLSYHSNMEELARHYRVYAVDVPGHGRSEKLESDYAVEKAAPFIAAFIRDVCGGSAALVGMSAGGLMCALTAATYPELVSHLVLVCSAGLGREIHPTLRLLTLPPLWRFVEGTQQTPDVMRLSMKRVVHDPECLSDEMLALLCEERARPGNARAMLVALRSHAGLLGVRRWRSYLRMVGRVGAPVMIIWGKQDKLIPVSHAYRAARWLGRRTRLHVIDRCGHWPPYERPDEFNRLVLDFVS